MTDSSDWLTVSEVSNKIVELVARARDRYGIPEGTKGADACRAVNLSLNPVSLQDGTDGFFNAATRTIVINSDVTWRPRIEFTIYHEIFHYLLNQDGELLEYFIEKLDGRESDLYRVTEECCNMGAAEFLIPRDRVRETIRERDISVDLIEHLADTGGVSLQASATQLATYAPEDCYVVICVHGPCSGGPFSTCLSIEHAAKKAHMKYPWRRGTVIPEDHLLHRVWRGVKTRPGRTEVVFCDGKSLPCVYGEAKKIGDSRVGGILYVGHDSPRTPRGRLAMGSPSY